MSESPRPNYRTQLKDGRAWRIGTDEDVAWINAVVTDDRSITTSVPPIYAAYATIAFPLDLESGREQMREAEDRFDDALIRVLGAQTAPQSWWLGFLDTGASDVVLPEAQRVLVYGCRYVLVQAGAREAGAWRGNDGRWFTALPELMFPADRSWIVSSLWDDAWAGVGGSADLISALFDEPELRARTERTNPLVPDMWPSSLPDVMHERLKR